MGKAVIAASSSPRPTVSPLAGPIDLALAQITRYMASVISQ